MLWGSESYTFDANPLLPPPNPTMKILNPHSGVILSDLGEDLSKVPTENRWRGCETRVTTGTIYTDKLFTGQPEMAGLGIYHYGARFYSPKLGRFLSPDSIVPSYANPLKDFTYHIVHLNSTKWLSRPFPHREANPSQS